MKTRQPTGKPSWPILLIAGKEKAGKTWAAAAASSSDLIDRTFWVGVGEDDPDEYGLIEGARFEIVEHEGTYRSILTALHEAVAEKGDKPNLIVLDSGTRMWELLCDMAQEDATRRAQDKARKANRPIPEDADITMDLWNTAKSRWQNILDALREHQGPSIITARLDEVAVMVNGKPTTERDWKVKAEKGLPYDVGAIVHLPERGKAWLTGVRSVRHQLPEKVELPEFTVDDLWRKLGLADAGERVHSPARTQDPNDLWADIPPEPLTSDLIEALEQCKTVEDIRAVWDDHHLDLTPGQRRALSAAMVECKGYLEQDAEVVDAEVVEPTDPDLTQEPLYA